MRPMIVDPYGRRREEAIRQAEDDKRREQERAYQEERKKRKAEYLEQTKEERKPIQPPPTYAELEQALKIACRDVSGDCSVHPDILYNEYIKQVRGVL